eukprot:13772593-Ditylum_brightwellii.AAC.1
MCPAKHSDRSEHYEYILPYTNDAFVIGEFAEKLLQQVVKNIEEHPALPENKHWRIPCQTETPLLQMYRSELDVLPVLNPIEVAYCQSLIGILQWTVELGRVDIFLDVSMISSHLDMPRERRLQNAFQIFAHLKKYQNMELAYYCSDSVIDKSSIECKNLTASEIDTLDSQEELLQNMPESCGQGFTVSASVDVDHTSDMVTR